LESNLLQSFEFAMRIDNLKQHPDFLPTLAQWHQGQWGELNPQKTLEMRISSLGMHLGALPIPVTFVAVEDNEPLGSASLVEHDLPTHRHLSPWLASVFVAPDRRRRGIGGRLVRRVMEEAARLSVETLYLFTLDQEKFYRELGWTQIERGEYQGFGITVMSIEPE
jgi:GNAT superfamily N-acetyltransferase